MPCRLLGTGPKLEQSPGNRRAGRWGGGNEWFKVTGSKWEPVAPYSTGGGGGENTDCQERRLFRRPFRSTGCAPLACQLCQLFDVAAKLGP